MSEKQTAQSKHWLDKVVDGILKWQEKTGIKQLHVDDMKTPSGRVHTGALRGVLLHDLVAQVLRERGIEPENTYVFNDVDPMDGLPAYLDETEFGQHMGKPLYKIPKPALDKCGIDLSQTSESELEDLKNAKNFAEIYAVDFMHAFRSLGCTQKIIWSHELYESGKMDEIIRLALDSVTPLRKIYQDVAKYELPELWYPFQVICPVCGKVGTTLVTGWDGQEVTFECQENKVTWAKGCGHKGKISPFGGNGKLLWKVDWPAHWTAIGVNVEGAGKDHSSAGGSRDMANAQCEQVFKIPVPFNIPYEWILIRGAKMSSSKGVGTSAREFTKLFPPAVGRFLFASRNYSQVIDFDPSTMAIPDLFDEYDQGARIAWGLETGDQRLARAFELAQSAQAQQTSFLPRFRDVAMWMQHPELNLEEEFAKIKGEALNDLEKSLIQERIHYAEVWVKNYAPSEYQLRPKAEMPEEAKTLSEEQKVFLKELQLLLTEKKDLAPADLQQAIFDLSKNSIGPRKAFESIYLMLLGKKAGPRAGWLLKSVDGELLDKRFKEIANL
ncbi:MAG: Lysine-tRNA ligase [Candidatus Pacebacteria bacterium GW2011_GWF2_38_9]|nr:MAG: lysyl-tRNA synthetase [candidate division TM6 bacterium GW2011_GWF2_28_16]KKQ88933.1 MAG: Lysine-tRNA ligase [Candidatus Pacebacteria bacterium GW2011_GWF2_38_9]HAZ73109.1 lysine--tRNA ligase [Candidatus Paceibacterota bacterium]